MLWSAVCVCSFARNTYDFKLLFGIAVWFCSFARITYDFRLLFELPSGSAVLPESPTTSGYYLDVFVFGLGV